MPIEILHPQNALRVIERLNELTHEKEIYWHADYSKDSTTLNQIISAPPTTTKTVDSILKILKQFSTARKFKFSNSSERNNGIVLEAYETFQTLQGMIRKENVKVSAHSEKYIQWMNSQTRDERIAWKASGSDQENVTRIRSEWISYEKASILCLKCSALDPQAKIVQAKDKDTFCVILETRNIDLAHQEKRAILKQSEIEETHEKQRINKPHITIFVNSLIATKKLPLSAEASEMISVKDRDAIHNYILQNMPNKLNVIYQLRKGESLRYPKEQTLLNRTFYIHRDAVGEIYVIPATMKKRDIYNPWYYRQRDAKDPTRVQKGACKKGTPTFISNKYIHGKEQPIFSLIVTGIANIQDAIQEAALTKHFDPKYVSHLEIGPTYRDRNGLDKCVLFSFEKATQGTLKNFISHSMHWKFIDQDGITTKLLKCVKELHQKNTVHQDIKLDNILVYKGVNLKIADLGLACTRGSGNIFGTADYMSPEVIHYFNQRAAQSAIGHKIAQTPTLPGQIALHQVEAQSLLSHTSALTADPAADMWAVGIVLYQLMHHGELPNFADPNVKEEIEQHYLLKGLLAFDPKNRFDIQAALDAHRDYLVSKAGEVGALITELDMRFDADSQSEADKDADISALLPAVSSLLKAYTVYPLTEQYKMEQIIYKEKIGTQKFKKIR